MTDAAFEILSREKGFRGFFDVDILRLRYRRFDGAWSNVLTRELCDRGEAATVLPYDPVRDRVLLVEQFRVAAIDDPQGSWLLEPVAGIMEPGESAEDVVRREAVEESGLVLRGLDPIACAYPSPGILHEQVHFFVGHADLPEEGGVYGLVEEDEDIRTHVLPLDETLASIGRDKLRSVTAIVTLLWLATHKERLRAAWAGR
ncbi:NUDIX domain-containing protein [Marinivivus vitaminiproducens]|uniref:NUDIX domain-containing protein n=1 Tax=Marinivivus vitaminiproducens TaxID=3035935 RepID=UPI0027A4620B|nr:NUDIX domain-containing protein [Geminicoccaceae bacterium SCSIO 64248]